MTDKCRHCRLPNRDDGYDACLGMIVGAMNACCGHGDVKCAYIQYRAEDAPDAIGTWNCWCVIGDATERGKCSQCGDERTFRISGEEVVLFLKVVD